MDQVKTKLSKVYGITSYEDKHIIHDSRTLADGQALSMLWIEPPPINFISTTLVPQPCYSIQRALRLTGATPYKGQGGVSSQIYNAFRNGILVSITSTPDGKCLQTIHIERDR